MNENEIDEILVKIGLKEFVDALPNGIDTNLGQLNDGIDLSKGQWQRLAIGRLLANSEANVWVLDEPTAYLDPIAEINLYKLILALSGERLVFFISHRLGFAQYADRIIVLKDGELVENGTHEELMKQQDSLYAKMFEAQREWYK